ncbi:sensor histidine kinase [Nocardia flavorosea]|uniref:sensor histidine kinase n=1 Tax=Nocardia flavorosea TaxID=53429 RepID=UPI002458AC82|nr:sensor histidine kinase [Nocardia flavorosea]
MRDAARSGTKRWALSNWDLRWKVTAVLAVPLAVAVGLGVSRISAQWSEANRLGSSAENVSLVPAVLDLSSATSTVAGSQAIAIAPNRSMVTEENLTTLDQTITAAKDALVDLDDLPGAHQALSEMIDQAVQVRAGGLAPSGSPDEAVAELDRARNAGVRTVEEIIGEVGDPSIDPDKLRLVDALNLRSAMVGEITAAAELLRDQETGEQAYRAATDTELTLLNILSQRYNAEDPDIVALREGVITRQAMLDTPEAQAGRIPLGEARESLLASTSTTDKLIGEATTEIDNGVQRMADRALSDAVIYSIVVLLTILAALLLAVFVARSMIVPLHRLRLAALRVAESDLPDEVAQLRTGAAPEEVPLEPMPIRSEEEIGQLARAIDDIHGQALRLASDQAQMRSQVNDMFETLARRSKSLVDHQLSLIEAMEYDEKDPRLLENLFRLDHLAARMRRNGDNLLILAGTKQRRAKSAPVEIADVLRAAISEVEDYERVKLGATPRGALIEPAASDMAHLFAELLDNALRASPPETDVKFTFAQAHDQGLLIEVADRGIGMPPSEMAEINRRLENTAEPGPDTARHMGLFVVGRLAERHGLNVRLRPTFDTARDPGVTVTVHVPMSLIVAGETQILPLATGSGPQPLVPSDGGKKPRPEESADEAAAAALRNAGGQPMQTRGISRTADGNMMVTVDPGMSGPLPEVERSKPGERPGGPAPAGPGGLPQRQPGSAMAGGLRDGEQGTTSLRQASAGSTAQRGKLAAANLPKRNLGPGGGGATPTLPPRTPGDSPAGGARPAESGPSGLPQRQAGTGGSPQPGAGGLPQRQPGGGDAPRPGPSGLPQRQPTGDAPQSGPGGLPQRKPAGDAPQSGPGGVPQRQPTGGDASPSGSGGLPQRRPGANGAPGNPHTPPARPDSGRPAETASDPAAPQRPAGPVRRPAPQAPTGLPQREPGTNGAREPGGPGLPQRRPAGDQAGRDQEPPQQAGTASGALPTRREPTRNGLPSRDTSGELPAQRGTADGRPSREPSGELPAQRGPAGGPLPRHEYPGNGLPQRGAGGSGLPQRSPAGNGRPRPAGSENGLPQRENTAMPRPDESGGLPRRQPGGYTAERFDNPPGVALPREPEPADDSAPAREPGRHSYKSNPAKTASFFQTRLQPAEETDSVMGGTPIFAEMMSAWLSDPNADRSQAVASFESPGDEGWTAARRASEAEPETRTAAGLPQRNPGGRLVPGAVNGAQERTPSRNPETIRSSLSRHQQGVRDGRAMRAMNLTGDKGDR